MTGVAFAQDAAPQADTADAPGDVIIVTAQRQSQSLQEVPIAVSAFSGEALEKQQIKNASDLQLTLPNVTFTKGNFTGSSFTIRGIGDLCVGVSCDSATAIHLDGTPLLGTRLFETEYFDLQRIEVLRGPQGTLFGRNATSGVVNFLPNRPDLSGFHASAEGEYGNYNSIKGKGMVNVALGDTIGVRVAGFYLNRDGYTKNVFDGKKFDGRDMYSVRGSLRFEPTENTTIDLLASYFHEKDNRLRIQKQVCQRDPTGILGCLANRRDFGTTNANSTFVGVLTSREFLATQGIPANFALGSLYGPDAYANSVNPRNVRQVNTDYAPTYETNEEMYQARIEQQLGDKFKLQLTGFYHKADVDSSQDYNLSVQSRAGYVTALTSLAAVAQTGIGLPGSAAYFAPLAAAIIPNGPAGNLCTSLPEFSGTGAFGGNKLCSATPQDFDRSNQKSRDWSGEAIFTSDLDGPFNFLLGGIYLDAKLTENSYFVNSFGIDYLTGLLGSFTGVGSFNPATGAYALPPAYLGTPFFRNNTDVLRVKSYGLFGEAYYDVNDRVKLTLGLRYNNDKKFVRARSTLASFLVPYSSTDAFSSPFVAAFDADPGIAGNQLFQERNARFSEFTGRAVLDFKITDDSLLYASYSRGYKSGGINPPLQPIFAVDESFKPEFVNAFEIGSKNAFANGKFIFNLTAFYYQYKQLQLSRIVARTSVNDNVDANIYGLEAEAIIRPTREFTVNIGASYLHTKVSQDKLLSNPRDPGGGRADAVIVKDITNGSNCAVASNTGNAAGVNTLVNKTNALINAGIVPGLKAGAGLQNTTAFPADSGLASTGAFSVCGALSAAAAGSFNIAALGPLGIDPAALGGATVLTAGVPVNIKGNKLPQAPNYKWSVGAQYRIEMSNDWSLTPRADLTYTGDSFGNIFNGRINKIQGFAQANAQIQLDGPQDRWFVRGYIQNIFDSNSTTGLYVTDQSSGLFTNIFTLEPRRYGIAAGVKF
ncbi:TonB-dependent receptor [Novosphingobium sp. Gsoil 351]|uniref:TonB-dependent receptor n=1 Tax=Novosphingobium sp. Gsoil 351 TaxID=2675225 RepID=UPI0012B4EA34|nr:TonB-dependent receptor [Novosphingobium sp. Gsoil 351]QGN53237.1 TonB-dependent receptor plug domain-containing protein [Novosphingobium sp. Gsoil 351]